MERLLYLEDCAASDPFCFKEQTIYFNKGMRPCALCDCSKGLPEPDMEKPEKSWTHELLGDVGKMFQHVVTLIYLNHCSLIKMTEQTAAKHSHFSNLFLDVTLFIIRLHKKAVLGQHNSFQQTEEIKEFPEL